MFGENIKNKCRRRSLLRLPHPWRLGVFFVVFIVVSMVLTVSMILVLVVFVVIVVDIFVSTAPL